MEENHNTAGHVPDTSFSRATSSPATQKSTPHGTNDTTEIWWDIADGVFYAGTAYSLVVGALAILVANMSGIITVWAGGSTGSFILTSLYLAAAWIFSSALAAILGALGTVLVILMTWPFVCVFLWTLGVANPALMGALFGGFAGFLATLPAVLDMPGMLYYPIDDVDWWVVTVVVALGPGLATIFGQIGGAWGGWNARAIPGHSNPSKKRASCDAPHGAASSVHVGSQRPTTPAFQFDVRQLLWIAFWLSLLMSMIRLTGVPFGVAIPLVVGWTLYQFATLAAGAYLLRRLGPWWAARQRSRST